MVPLTTNRLDSTSRRDWEILNASKTEPVEYSSFKKFMQERLRTLDSMPSLTSKYFSGKDSKQEKFSGDKKSNISFKNYKSHNLNKQNNQSGSNKSDKNSDNVCALCSKAHFISYCFAFKGKSSKEKLDFVNSSKLCYNCLGRHHIKECKTTKTCLVCNSKHHTMLHDTLRKTSSSSTSQPVSQSFAPAAVQSSDDQSNSTKSSTAHNTTVSINSSSSNAARSECVLLGTAAVRVESDQGTFINARALVDPCSEITLIAKSLVKRLRLPSEKCSIQISGVGDAVSTTLGISRFFIRSRIKKSCCYQVEAYILDHGCPQ